jgi:hypothetical protein
VENIQTEAGSQDDFKYTLAGWCAIATAVLLVPYALISLILDIRPDLVPVLIPFLILIVAVEMTCSIVAFILFRTLLNERYEFHEIDNLVPILVIGSIAITCVAFVGRLIPAIRIPALVMLFVLDVPVAITGIVYGTRLLRLRAKLHGLLKPLAYTHILAGIFFLTLILSLLGLLTMAAFYAMLGVLFLRGEEEDQDVEFV